MTSTRPTSARRPGRRTDRVTNVELFFDLVYVFAVTQIARVLVEHPNGTGAAHAAVLLLLVWQVWVYTTWTVNYLDPDQTLLRLTLLGLMFGSLVLSAAIPDAFTEHGLVVAVAFVAMQLGRTVISIWATRGEVLLGVMARLLPWSALAGVAVIAGGLLDGWWRVGLWVGGVAIELVGAAAGFWVPLAGRSRTTDWTVSGAHFAERCQAFVLIALGESIVATGSRLDLDDVTAGDLLAFAAAFVAAVLLWWIYFDRAAEASSARIAAARDPGRLARNAFHALHPVIIGGIIVTAAADERFLEHPFERGDEPTVWLILGGVALFLAGHAAFVATVWRVVPWARIAAAVVLLALGALAPYATPFVVGIATLVVLLAVIVSDRVAHRPGPA